MNGGRGLVLFGDVVGSRRDPTGAGEWLRGLAGRLDAVYGDARLAPFGFTQGDELQGLLATTADPLAAVLVAGLDEAARPMRWVAVAGEVAAGRGPATERSGAGIHPGPRLDRADAPAAGRAPAREWRSAGRFAAGGSRAAPGRPDPGAHAAAANDRPNGAGRWAAAGRCGGEAEREPGHDLRDVRPGRVRSIQRLVGDPDGFAMAVPGTGGRA